MSTQRGEILERLGEHGWSVGSLGPHTLDWWADEIWLLESTWSPAGARAYLVFLVDPQADTAGRGKGEGVWAVSATPIKPLSREEAESRFVLSLGGGWEEKLPKLLEYLSAVRDAV